uniref:IS91 family transposase n=1 Tax=Coprococcus comes TaxID=410072 RepID=UPI003A8A6DD0
MLDAPYFHVVFTVPEELNPIIYSNQKFLYTALYHAASDTLSELAADSKYLGTNIGYICILHTWGSTMNFHPHIHAIVLGGGLDVKNHWKDNGKEFFLPIKVISKIFRGKYMAELKQLWENDRLEFHGSAAPYKNYYTFKELLNTCYTLVDVLFAYLKKMEPTVPTSGQLRKAYTYILNQEKYLRVFLEDGEVPIDNNASERAIRGFCIGKKNWQMIDTINGAHSSAIIYSIAETAKANNLKPYDYFVYLLEEIPKHMEQKDRTFLEDLLPWSKKLPEGIRKQQ